MPDPAKCCVPRTVAGRCKWWCPNGWCPSRIHPWNTSSDRAFGYQQQNSFMLTVQMWEFCSKISGYVDSYRPPNLQIWRHPCSRYTTCLAPCLHHIIPYFSWFAETNDQIWPGFSNTGSDHVLAHSLPAHCCWLRSALNILFLHLRHTAIILNLYTCKSWQVSCHGFHTKKSTNWTQLFFYI